MVEAGPNAGKVKHALRVFLSTRIPPPPRARPAATSTAPTSPGTASSHGPRQPTTNWTNAKPIGFSADYHGGMFYPDITLTPDLAGWPPRERRPRQPGLPESDASATWKEPSDERYQWARAYPEPRPSRLPGCRGATPGEPLSKNQRRCLPFSRSPDPLPHALNSNTVQDPARLMKKQPCCSVSRFPGFPELGPTTPGPKR